MHSTFLDTWFSERNRQVLGHTVIIKNQSTTSKQDVFEEPLPLPTVGRQLENSEIYLFHHLHFNNQTIYLRPNPISLIGLAISIYQPSKAHLSICISGIKEPEEISLFIRLNNSLVKSSCSCSRTILLWLAVLPTTVHMQLPTEFCCLFVCLFVYLTYMPHTLPEGLWAAYNI